MLPSLSLWAAMAGAPDVPAPKPTGSSELPPKLCVQTKFEGCADMLADNKTKAPRLRRNVFMLQNKHQCMGKTNAQGLPGLFSRMTIRLSVLVICILMRIDRSHTAYFQPYRPNNCLKPETEVLFGLDDLPSLPTTLTLLPLIFLLPTT